MQLTRVMLNSELPSVYSGKSPFANHCLARSYNHFHKLANSEQRQMFFASAEDYHQGTVNGHWIPWGNEWVPVGEKISSQFIFNKLDANDPEHQVVINDAIQRQIPIYGEVELGRFVSDKWQCYQVFQDYFALTARIEQDENTIVGQIHDFFKRMDEMYTAHDQTVVLKPVGGWEARGIHLVTKEKQGLQLRYLFGQPIEDAQLTQHILKLFAHIPYIIQAYVNTRSGIPEIGLGSVEFHDVRFVFYIKEPGVACFFQLYIKTPQGMIYYPIEYFPQEAFSVIEPVATKVANMFSYGVFSVDIMRDVSGRWYLTELNDQIGFNINWQHVDDIKNVSYLMQTFLEEMDRLENRQKA